MSLEAESEAETTAASKDYDLLVIGPGHLGARVATLWQQKFPNAMIALKANRQDLNREAKWHSLGFVSHQEENGRKYNYVLFSAPPSGQYILVREPGYLDNIYVDNIHLDFINLDNI